MMKIKHWQGYGTVNAKKISKTVENGKTILVVKVSGNHEWGLVREDLYDLKWWLIDRFDKAAKDISPYEYNFSFIDDYGQNDEEYCIYTFEYEV